MMRALLISLSLTGAILPAALGKGYDSLTVDPRFQLESQDLTVHDAARNRDIPVRVYLPANEKPQPVVLFSHGLGGSRAGSKFLGEHWAARGYVAVFVQHQGSDDAVWKEAAPEERMAALREAASLENFLLRVKDVTAVLDQLEAWNKSGPLAGRMDLKKIGMSGLYRPRVARRPGAAQSESSPRDPRAVDGVLGCVSARRQGSARVAERDGSPLGYATGRRLESFTRKVTREVIDSSG